MDEQFTSDNGFFTSVIPPAAIISKICHCPFTYVSGSGWKIGCLWKHRRLFPGQSYRHECTYVELLYVWIEYALKKRWDGYTLFSSWVEYQHFGQLFQVSVWNISSSDISLMTLYRALHGLYSLVPYYIWLWKYFLSKTCTHTQIMYILHCVGFILYIHTYIHLLFVNHK